MLSLAVVTVGRGPLDFDGVDTDSVGRPERNQQQFSVKTFCTAANLPAEPPACGDAIRRAPLRRGQARHGGRCAPSRKIPDQRTVGHWR